MTYDLETLQKVGGGIAALAIGVFAVLGSRRSDGKPPEDRAPSPHAVREAMADLRAVLAEIRADLEDDRGASTDRYHELRRHLDRIEAHLRMADAVAAARRETTIPPRPHDGG